MTRKRNELWLFMCAAFTIGMAGSMIDATLNNFLNAHYALTVFQRAFVEFPRELPGFSIIFVSALLWFLCSRRLGSAALFFSGLGSILLALFAPTYTWLMAWLFIYSLGQHLFMPVASTIGMELAEDGKTGKRLGQLNALRNGAAILGSFLVFLGFKYAGLSFHSTFIIAAILFFIGAVLLFRMQPDHVQKASLHLKLHKSYSLYYVLAILFGSRKQVFVTFAPWVLVTVYQQSTSFLATLFTVGGIIGIAFQPILGWTIDKFGERSVIIGESLLLIAACLGYGLSKFLFAPHIAFLVVCACFLLDQMLMSVNMARATYMKKIALNPSHIQQTLTMGISIDHIFSISLALLGGIVWNHFGFHWVFMAGAGIAGINFLAALRMKPRTQANRT